METLSVFEAFVECHSPYWQWTKAHLVMVIYDETGREICICDTLKPGGGFDRRSFPVSVVKGSRITMEVI